LHYEMGLLLWRTGQLEAGEQWMLRALALDPDHTRAHAALADHYERLGNKTLSDQHRKLANK
jgi:Tfp pilus assembly protein PilF